MADSSILAELKSAIPPPTGGVGSGSPLDKAVAEMKRSYSDAVATMRQEQEKFVERNTKRVKASMPPPAPQPDTATEIERYKREAGL